MPATLHTSALAAQAHPAIVLPWLRRALTTAPGTPLPTAILVPLRADAYHLKSLALAAGLGLCGIHFLTPGELRDRLIHHLGLTARVPLREHLRLLLATAAERVADRAEGEGPGPIATAPDQLLKAIDTITGAGWTFAEAGPPRLRPVVAEFQRLLADAGFSMVHDLDRALLAAAPSAPPLFADLLVTGFNALHWPQWPLLESAVRAAQNATVCLTDPRPEGEDLDAAWVGTWEETFGASQPIGEDFPSPLAEILRLPESAAERTRREAEPAPAVTFLVGQDTAEQARVIVAQALHYLADPACTRLGLLFPAAGALSRHVAILLAEHDVPHHDGLAHHAPGLLEEPAWPAWLALQENPRLPALLRFLQARPDADFGKLSVNQAASELQRVYQNLLLDDLSVLALHLARHSSAHHAPTLAAALEALPILPARAPLADMIARTDAIFRELGWPERAAELQRLAAEWRRSARLEISRRTWLRWLGETLDSWRAARAPAGAHPYSRLHLLPYAQAESQSWTHLIATGLNEGVWPPSLEDAGFLDEEEIDALNRRLRALNTRASTQGGQGEGHIAVQPGKAFCLGPAQRRALAPRQFFNTLESVSTALAVSAQLQDEAAPDRPFNPSEFFARLHFCARGRAVEQDTMGALRAETARWLEAASPFPSVPSVPTIPPISSTLHAHTTRRLPDQPFGEYEFALRSLPQPLRLAAKRWEDALASPAEVWLAAVLGVSASRAEEETPWALAQGNWVHDWLRALAAGAEPGGFVPLPAPAEMRSRVRAVATAFRERVASVLTLRGRALPDWWVSAWEQALAAATALVESVSRAPGRTHAAAEWKLADTALSFADGPFAVHGRVDLLLTAGPSLDDTWLVDYKTGSRPALNLKTLATGSGVQLALYALALRAAGARTVGLSLLTPTGALDAPQLTLADLDTLTGLWRGLWRMQSTGVFGLRGALREEYGPRRDYPLATLAIDEEILAEKWALTHPDLTSPEADS